MRTNLEKSYKDRIKNIAKDKNFDPAMLWQNIILERFLVRLSKSPYSKHFILQGGVLLSKLIKLNRYTKDLDFAVKEFKEISKTLENVMDKIINTDIKDGFNFSKIKIGDIPHPNMKYPGKRVHMVGHFGKTRFKISIDLAFGDLINPLKISLPLTHGKKGALFESSVSLSCYSIEFIFAEKLHSIIERGRYNSRMKDFHDLYSIIFQKGKNLSSNIENIIKMVFEHRQTELTLPIVFSNQAIVDLQSFWARYLQGLKKDHKMPKKLKNILQIINDWLNKNTKL
jgi:predicted nucleotidyltransferase component of viral defense system